MISRTHTLHRRTAAGATLAVALGLLTVAVGPAGPARAITPGWQELTYGAHGLKVAPGGSDQYGGGGTVDSAGRVLVLSPVQPTVQQIQLTRLTVDGAGDPAFGTSGTVALPAGSRYTSVLAAGDAVFVAGPPASGNDLSLVRLSTGGVVDTGFGTNGLATVTLPSAVGAVSGLARLSNGDLLVTTESLTLPGTSYAVAVNPATGALDPSWNAGGTVPGLVSSSSQIRGVAADGTTSLLLVVSDTGVAQVQRRTGTGTVDATFGVGGARVLSSSFGAEQVSVESDGNYYVEGSFGTNRVGQLAVARILPSGTLDSGFGTAGIARVTLSDCGPTARSVAIGGSSLYVFGQHTFGDRCTQQPIVARLTTAGVLDPTFGSGGFIQIGYETLGTGNSLADGLYDGGVQPGGAPVLALRLIALDVTRMGGIRLNADTAAPAGAYVPLLPRRILDTRSGTGAPAHAVAAAGTVGLAVAGHGGVPSSGVGAVVLNLTAVGSTRGGFVTAYPHGTTRPGASNVNYPAGATTPNAVTVGVGTGGTVDLYNGSSGTVQLLADVVGYYRAGPATAAGAFTAITPTRVLDTRIGLGAPPVRVLPQSSVDFAVGGQGGVPASNVSAVVANVTAVSPPASGYLTAYATGATRPRVSTLNYAPGLTRANLATVKVGTSGKLTVYNGSTQPVNVVVDVAGYYLGGTPTEPGTYVAVDPQRLLDTRTVGLPDPGPMRADSSRPVTGPDGAGALVLNGTVTAPTRSGFMAYQGATEFYDGHFPVSALNFAAHQTAANMVIVAPDGFTIVNRSSGTAQAIVDLEGYFLP